MGEKRKNEALCLLSKLDGSVPNGLNVPVKDVRRREYEIEKTKRKREKGKAYSSPVKSFKPGVVSSAYNLPYSNISLLSTPFRISSRSQAGYREKKEERT